MAEEGKLPEEVTPELTFAAIMDTNAQVREVGEVVQEIKTNDLPHIEAKVDTITQRVEENPSLVWLLRYKTSKTVRVLLAIALAIVAASIWASSRGVTLTDLIELIP